MISIPIPTKTSNIITPHSLLLHHHHHHFKSQSLSQSFIVFNGVRRRPIPLRQGEPPAAFPEAVPPNSKETHHQKKIESKATR